MTSARFAILDPAAGISGDMLLGALVDAGAPAEWLMGLPARLGFPDVRVVITRASRCGIDCGKVTIQLADGSSEGPSPAWAEPHHHSHPAESHHHHLHDHDHHGTGGHRHLADLARIIGQAPLSDWVRERAVAAFRLLCEEEGKIHGVAPEAVALHEVGAIDAVVDIVGGIEGFEQLGIRDVYTRPVALGQGWIRAAHGTMPVPAPVTARILEGIEIAPNGPVTGEATTPTGAVLLRVLAGGAIPGRWRTVRSGWGAGGRDPERYPNALRLLIVEPAVEAGQVVTLSSDVDDLSPEYLASLREAMVSAGAQDVQVWTTQMKKGRIGFRIEVVVDPAHADAVTEAMFLHSTTAGVRRALVERVTLPRRQIEVAAPDGSPVRVKVLDTPGGPRVKPEYDDISALARRLGRPAHEVAREVEQRARLLVTAPVAGESSTLKKEKE